MNDSQKLPPRVVAKSLLLGLGMGDVLEYPITIRIFRLSETDGPKVYVRNSETISYQADITNEDVLSHVNNRDLVFENDVFYSVTKVSAGDKVEIKKAPIPVYKNSLEGMQQLKGLLAITRGKIFMGGGKVQIAQDRTFHEIGGSDYVVVRTQSGEEYYETCETAEKNKYGQLGDFEIVDNLQRYCYGSRKHLSGDYVAGFTAVHIYPT
ncbi:hypothetical protein [Pseudomonas oryzicola]|uniref:Uncharacterized protein n=1 Tax=Pseudomonas oryzicola TaxID=485876 RepID=A0ABS6Q8U1_9PSED|nr:hypothetical protein [Pseudomonas oryzicola]MBV4490353.1 hypothetical protein [Pseudomonas oryzicola]